MRPLTINEIFDNACRQTFGQILDDLAARCPTMTPDELGASFKAFIRGTIRPQLAEIDPPGWAAIDRLIDRLVAERDPK